MSENGKSSNSDTAMSLDPKNQRGQCSNESSPTTGAMREPGSGFRTLLAATFVVFLGYGTVLPILPLFLGQVLSVVGESDVSLHTGLLRVSRLNGVYGLLPIHDHALLSPDYLVGRIGGILADELNKQQPQRRCRFPSW
ncbi:hypothetical protein SAMN02745148_03106 [Modicisalibacter ilicicola DSM 19980]|uniref:Uncharacterized protein n=1 Tax=Modicisalibacter ilicicola DSM 19980 TaxID=1121942 RepID=A0A1M5D1R0_9GAMM|nr:hypothetical protein [Halomonas ilicicola]SHF60765.1 hypothetical protein SAMN02745148_03106 [Halomonas ilicicola DSM 19980]